MSAIFFAKKRIFKTLKKKIKMKNPFILNKALNLYTLICLLAIGVSSDYEIMKVSPQGQIAHKRVLILANSLHILNKANLT